MKPTEFWCNDCQAWTEVEEATERHIQSGVAAFDEFWCSRCAGDYVCGDCGYMIDRYGTCLRTEHTGEHCPSEEA